MQVQLTGLERAFILDAVRKRAAALPKEEADPNANIVLMHSRAFLQRLYHKLYGHGDLFPGLPTLVDTNLQP